MLNNVTIMGRLTRDPELRYTGSGIPVASFSIACERDYANSNGGKEVDFINCVAWRSTGDFVSKYFNKGSMIVISGRLQVRKWVDNDGNNRTTTEVVANNVYFGVSKKSSDENTTDRQNNRYSGYSSYPSASNQGYSDYGYLDDDDDGDLPF